MPEPEIEKKSDRADPATIAALATKRTSGTSDTNGATPPADKPAPDALTKEATYSKPPDYLDDALKRAERLVKYAAETGTDIDPAIRNSILQARRSSSNGWNEATTANLLTALTNLAVQVKPVTVESLNWSDNKDTNWALRHYYWAAILLALVIAAGSVATFVAPAISNAIRTDIAAGNELAVKLRGQLGPLPTVTSITSFSSAPASSTSTPPPSGSPPGINANDVITELQQFAATIRTIDARAQQLNLLVLGLVRDPFADIRRSQTDIKKRFELPTGLPDLAKATSERIWVFQDARYFAQNVLDEVLFYYGAITACILPVLYALLGTCAYLLRSFKRHIRNQTFIPSYANFARFIIAGIGGAVVGLFNNFSVTQGVTISPLAIAFLVGYAVDVFYAFLDGLLQTFIKNTPAPPLPSPAGKKP
jgi:hypothetical protein